MTRVKIRHFFQPEGKKTLKIRLRRHQKENDEFFALPGRRGDFLWVGGPTAS